MRLSIIIPCYNIASYIKRIMDSILSQSFEDFEVILVNDGSSDNTLEILQLYATIDSRIHVINQKNKGVSSARNAGLSVAQGEYVSFIDGDDWMEANIFSVLDGDNFTDIYLFGFLIHYMNKKNITFYPPSESENIFVKYVLGNRLILPCMIFRRRLILDNNIKFDEHTSHGEDKEFMMKALFVSQKVKSLQRLGYHYDKTRETSVTNSLKFTEEHLTELQALDRVVAFIKKYGCDKEIQAIMIHRCVDTLFVYRKFLRSATFEQRYAFNYFFNERINDCFDQRIQFGLYRYTILFYFFKLIRLLSPCLFRNILKYL